MKENNFHDWHLAFGISNDEEIEPSYFLQSLAEANIIGLINDSTVENTLITYYQTNNSKQVFNDIATFRIKCLINSNEFSFSKEHLCQIHKAIFNGILSDAGNYRKLFLTKQESLLNNDTVFYANYNDIDMLLTYDFAIQKEKMPMIKSANEALKLLPRFIANIWQAHPFMDGNTRTIAVFLYQYLKNLKIPVYDDALIKSIPYFRDALVIANYQNKGQAENFEYLNLFFEKILIDPSITLDRNLISLNEKSR